VVILADFEERLKELRELFKVKEPYKWPRPTPQELFPVPKIEIDYSKCQTPFHCKKCLQICPQAVFYVAVMEQTRFKETDPRQPGSYMLIPLFVSKCTVCNRCVEVCPADAIKIEAPEV